MFDGPGFLPLKQEFHTQVKHVETPRKRIMCDITALANGLLKAGGSRKDVLWVESAFSLGQARKSWVEDPAMSSSSIDGNRDSSQFPHRSSESSKLFCPLNSVIPDRDLVPTGM